MVKSLFQSLSMLLFCRILVTFSRPCTQEGCSNYVTLIGVMQIRVVFNWVSKVISRLLWFCITTLCDWLTKLTFSTNGNPNQNQSCFVRMHFPAVGTSYMYLLRILIGSLCCLHLLRLARVITWILVL